MRIVTAGAICLLGLALTTFGHARTLDTTAERSEVIGYYHLHQRIEFCKEQGLPSSQPVIDSLTALLEVSTKDVEGAQLDELWTSGLKITEQSLAKANGNLTDWCREGFQWASEETGIDLDTPMPSTAEQLFGSRPQ